MRAHLVSHRAGERLDGALGRGVGGEATGADRGPDELGREVDDAPVAGGDHRAQGALGAEKRAHHVDREHRLIALDRGVEELAARHHAGVVDENVEAAQAREHQIDHGADLVRARDVRAYGLGPPSELLELGHDFFRSGGTGVVIHRHVGALAAERERDRAAESATCSGYQCDASVQTSHASILT